MALALAQLVPDASGPVRAKCFSATSRPAPGARPATARSKARRAGAPDRGCGWSRRRCIWQAGRAKSVFVEGRTCQNSP